MDNFFYITWDRGTDVGTGGPYPSQKQAATGLELIAKQELRLRGAELEEFLEASVVWQGHPDKGGSQVGNGVYEEPASESDS